MDLSLKVGEGKLSIDPGERDPISMLEKIEPDSALITVISEKLEWSIESMDIMYRTVARLDIGFGVNP